MQGINVLYTYAGESRNILFFTQKCAPDNTRDCLELLFRTYLYIFKYMLTNVTIVTPKFCSENRNTLRPTLYDSHKNIIMGININYRLLPKCNSSILTPSHIFIAVIVYLFVTPRKKCLTLQ